MREMRAFLFDKYHTWYDWRLTLTGKDHPAPEPNFNYIKLEGANGSIDATEALTGETTYADRPMTASFRTSEGTREERDALLREISAALHGRKVQIIEPDDPDHFYLGRCKIKTTERSAVHIAFDVEATCDPWRYAVEETERRVDVLGAVDVVLWNHGQKTLCPEIHVSGSVTVTFGGEPTALSTGVYKLSHLKLRAGAAVVSLTGSGTVTFYYREASL